MSFSSRKINRTSFLTVKASALLSWNLFGKINAVYLFGKKAVPVYSLIALAFIFLGTLASNDLVGELTDLFNNLMVIPNVIALFALTQMAVLYSREKKDAKRHKM